MRERYPDAEIVRDVGSELNFRRKGLLALLVRLHQGDKFRVVVAYRDRLARFGTGLIETLLQRNGGELVVLKQRHLSREEELTTDLLAIFTVFRPPRQRTPALPQGNQGGPSSTLTPRQRAELCGWFGAARYAYNQTVELLRSEYAPPAVKAKVRDHILPTLPPWHRSAPRKVLVGAIFDACRAVSAGKRRNAELARDKSRGRRQDEDFARVRFRPLERDSGISRKLTVIPRPSISVEPRKQVVVYDKRPANFRLIEVADAALELAAAGGKDTSADQAPRIPSP